MDKPVILPLFIFLIYMIRTTLGAGCLCQAIDDNARDVILMDFGVIDSCTRMGFCKCERAGITSCRRGCQSKVENWSRFRCPLKLREREIRARYAAGKCKMGLGDNTHNCELQRLGAWAMAFGGGGGGGNGGGGGGGNNGGGGWNNGGGGGGGNNGGGGGGWNNGGGGGGGNNGGGGWNNGGGGGGGNNGGGGGWNNPRGENNRGGAGGGGGGGGQCCPCNPWVLDNL